MEESNTRLHAQTRNEAHDPTPLIGPERSCSAATICVLDLNIPPFRPLAALRSARRSDHLGIRTLTRARQRRPTTSRSVALHLQNTVARDDQRQHLAWPRHALFSNAPSSLKPPGRVHDTRRLLSCPALQCRLVRSDRRPLKDGEHTLERDRPDGGYWQPGLRSRQRYPI